ncbi:hypothetical protein PIB30_085740 [Stylosanthes scabra]|uniref:Uncharacterized protein n=1 Tax=Stylosanthes scabra TaxID=79078 RepID=A0ABU6URS3_9FABA|nr:hypothetical protein [Stylosanthes scabra]
MSGRGSRGSLQSSRGRGRGKGRATLSSEHTPSPSPTTSTPGTSQVAASPQINADSSHAFQSDPPAQQVVQIPITWDDQKEFDPDNNDCTQAISDVIELMLNEPWINYSEIPEDVQKRWFKKWAEGFTCPEAQSKQIWKSFDYRAGRRYQQIMRDLRGSELQRLKWMSETLRKLLLDRFANDLGFKKCQASSKANRAPSKGGCLHTGGSVTIPKTHARMTRSLDRPPIDAEVFRPTHTHKRDRSIVEKHTDDLLTEYSTNLEQATQQAQEEGDESVAAVDPDVVWRQTLSEPCKNRVMDLREQVQNLTQSLETRGHMLQQQIDEVRSLRDTLAERYARAEEHLRRMEEMRRQMAAFYNPLHLESSATAGGSSTAPPLPPRPPPQHPHPEDDDDDDYEDA